MTSADWLATNTAILEEAGVPSARLDCLILLEDATGKDRGWLLAHPGLNLSNTIIDKLSKYVTRRSRHEPLAYIRHKTEFYGRNFYVNHHVLEPRPESETIIKLLKALPLPEALVIADIGTGSGALAVTAKLELPQSRVLAADIDPTCLQVAQRNAKQHSARLEVIQADLLAGLPQTPDVILANLPYVPNDFHINLAAGHEPRRAIFGGPDGLDLYRRLFRLMRAERTKNASLQFALTESLPSQHQQLEGIARDAGYSLQATEDFIQVFELTI